MFSPEIQQIQTILEAESANAPFAFSVPQEAVDQALRFGGNTDQHRMVIAMDFIKQKSIEQVADHLREIYHGGNGLTVKGKKYAVWYDADGLRIAAGTSARYVNMAQLVSWEDAARRIGDLMDAGQFVTPLEIAEAPGYERRQAAEALLYLRQDLSEKAVAQGFLPSLVTLGGDGFPEKTAELTERLAHADFCETLDDELIAFRDACHQDRDLLRFHFHAVEDVLTRTEELMLPHLDYTSNLAELPEVGTFITEDELTAALSSGSSMAGGKDRIYRYFTDVPAHTTKDKADFLKHEYGIGGRSHALSGSSHSGEDHDSKGIRFKKEGCEEIRLSWNEVARRIDKLIIQRRYLTPEEQKLVEMRSMEEPVPALEESEEEIHPAYIRERLAEYGIEHGEVVDPEKLAQSPFIQQVEATVAQIEQEEELERQQGTSSTVRDVYEQFLPMVKSLVLKDEAYQNACKNSDQSNAYLEGDAAIKRAVSTIQDEGFLKQYYDQNDFRDRLHRDILETTYAELSSVQSLPDLTEQPIAQAPSYQVGDTVFLEDGKPFIIEKTAPLDIELRDPSLVYPVLRAESQESFARLMEQYPQPQKQPEVTSETVVVYPAEQNKLPYDVVVERMVTAPEKEHIKQPPAQNFHITDDHLGEGGPKAKYANNIAAIRTLKQIEAEGRAATPEEQEILSRYVGWGGIPDAFDDGKPEWAKEYAELKELLTPQE